MTYSWTARPGGYALAPCLQTLCEEIRRSPKYGPHLTNLGELGDVRHTTEGLQSDHNPWLTGGKTSKYPGVGYVRAVDLGGPISLLTELRDYINDHLYAKKFAPLWPYGYTKGPDDKITTWFSTTGALHVDSGDQGHLHVSVTHGGTHPVAGSSEWIAALDSTTPWGVYTAPKPPPPKPPVIKPIIPPHTLEPDMIVQFPTDTSNGDTSKKAVYLYSGGVLLWLTPEEFHAAGSPKPSPLDHTTAHMYLAHIAAGTPDPRVPGTK